MNLDAMQLYRKMQHDINELRKTCKCEIAMIEGCFNIASHYWNHIKQWLESYLFSNENDEIYFFKNIKPLFIAAIEYYTLYYQAILFKPSDDAPSLAAYWLHQLKRVENFYTRHKDFYLYYTSGQTCSDSIYFIRRSNTGTATGRLLPGTTATTSHDHIAARIIGYQQYLQYVEQQLEILVPGDIKDPIKRYSDDTRFFDIPNGSSLPLCGSSIPLIKNYSPSIKNLLKKYFWLAKKYKLHFT